jgi:diadenosine tetraphosphate (Ap4A) HIT family hydrolase
MEYVDTPPPCGLQPREGQVKPDHAVGRDAQRCCKARPELRRPVLTEGADMIEALLANHRPKWAVSGAGCRSSSGRAPGEHIDGGKPLIRGDADRLDRMRITRRLFNADGYEDRVRNGPCFVCGIVRDTPPQPESVIYRDKAAIAFLSRPSAQLGHSLVAPIDHRTDVVDSFTSAAYLELQSLIYRVGRALTRTVPTERLYIMSMGSHQGNAHVHWHLVPLPPGVPYADQQFNAVMLDRAGYVEITAEDEAALCASLRAVIER